MVERELPKLIMRVRFPLPAPINKKAPLWCFFCLLRAGSEKRRRTSGFDYQRKACERTPVAAGNERLCDRVFFKKTKVIPVARSNKQKGTLVVLFLLDMDTGSEPLGVQSGEQPPTWPRNLCSAVLLICEQATAQRANVTKQTPELLKKSV